MGSRVSLSRSPPASPSAAAAENGRRVAATTAKVVDLDGFVAQFAGPATTVREALLGLGDGGGRRRAPPCFLCSSDELSFDAPALELAAGEPLQPGQLYFVLPTSVLRRPLSGQDMAALAVKASTALASDTGAGVSSLRRRKGGDRRAGGKRGKAARVAPVEALMSRKDGSQHEGAWNRHAYGTHGTAAAHGGDRTVGKTTRHGIGHGGGARPYRAAAGVQRLSAIAEGNE